MLGGKYFVLKSRLNRGYVTKEHKLGKRKKPIIGDGEERRSDRRK